MLGDELFDRLATVPLAKRDLFEASDTDRAPGTLVVEFCLRKEYSSLLLIGANGFLLLCVLLLDSAFCRDEVDGWLLRLGRGILLLLDCIEFAS